MKNLSRVVWSEGMYLGPHDFQAQSKWFEDSVEFGTEALWFKPYGFMACDINHHALANGTFSLVHARGIFPDGLPFLMDECDSLPAPRSVADLWAPTATRLLMSLAVPKYKLAERNTATPDMPFDNLRFIAQERKFVDETTGADEKDVAVARKNIQIVADTESTAGMSLLPLARIRRDRDGKFICDENFIPPCIRITASTRLLTLTERLIAIVAEKSEAVRTSSPVSNTFSAGLSSRQIESFWFRHALNSSLPLLRHLCFSQRGHPEDLYRELLRLGGALCTFGLDSNAAELPLYDHQDLENCFGRLDEHIREHLEMLAPANCIVIPLSKSSNYFFNGEIKDARCLGRSRWLLAVRSPLDEASLITRVPNVVKVCSSRFIAQLVKRAVPGLRLTPVPVPPAAATPRVDTQYFSLNMEGPCWEDMTTGKQVGVYVPGDIPDPELELLVLVEGK